MRLSVVFGIVGYQLRLFSIAFLAPLALALWDGHWRTATYFVTTMIASFVIGTWTRRAFDHGTSIHRAEALAVVTFTWSTICVFAAIPYVWDGLSVPDALFESMSGLTTTGATILTDFSIMDRSLFLWRAMTQWFGGVGVIALFVAVLPRLGIAGRQLFFAEASGAPAEAVSPRIRDTAGRLWVLYTGLTVALVLLLLASGMSLYDAVCHAFTTLPAGGFSPNPESLAGYHMPQAEWILSLFMFIAGASFTLQYKVITTGRPLELLRDGEFMFYFGVAAVITLGVSFTLAHGAPSFEHVRLALFQVTSLMSSTGFASTDYNLWSDNSRVLLIIVMLIGGCAGSAAGGPKAIRYLLFFKDMFRELRRVLHPQAVLPVIYKERPVPEKAMHAVFMLVVLFVVGYVVFGALLVVMGAEVEVGLSAALACLSNIGPGFGAVGPMGNFGELPDVSKLVLTFAMLIGRLEMVTVLALLHPDVLRNLRLR